MRACGVSGDLRVNDSHRTYNSSSVLETYVEFDLSVCSKETKRPGDSSHSLENTWSYLYPGPGGSSGSSSKVRLAAFPNGRFFLFAQNTELTSTSSRNSSESTFACTENTQANTINISTLPVGEKQSTTLYGQGTSNQRMEIKKPPVPKTLTAVVEGEYVNDIIAGSKLLAETKPSFKGDYQETITASWNFRRVQGSCACIGYIPYLKGDVKIDGKTVKAGDPVTSLKGIKIETGPKSRVQIDFGDTIVNVGQKSQVEIGDPCEGEDSTLIDRIIGMGCILLSGRSSEFVYVGNNAHAGVRGQLTPAPLIDPAGVYAAALLPLSIPFLFSEADSHEDLMPEAVEVKMAYAAFLVDNTPGKPLFVKAIKGSIEVFDSTGGTTVLAAGETFSKTWNPALAEADTERVRLKVIAGGD